MKRAVALVFAATLFACGSAGQGAKTHTPGPLTSTPEADFRARAPAQTAERMLKVPQVLASRLENGLSLWIVERPDLPLVSVAYANRAAFDRDTASAGLAAITLEALRSTPSRADRAAAADETDIETMSGFVSRQGAVLQATTTADRLENSFERLARAVRRTLDDGSVLAAKGVVKTQLWKERIQVGSFLRNLLASSLYADDQLLALPINGTKATLETRSPAEIRAFHARYYVPSASALIVVGAVRASEVASRVRQHFGDWAGPDVPVSPLPAPKLSGTDSSVLGADSAGQRAIVAVGLPCAGSREADNVAFDVIAAMLAGGQGARAQLVLRHSEGNTSRITASCRERVESGDFVVTFDVEPQHAGEAGTRLLAEIRKFAEEPALQGEIDAGARAHLGELADRMASNARFTQLLGSLFMSQRPANYYDTVEDRMLRIGPDDIRRAAKNYFGRTKPRLAVYGDARVLDPQFKSIAPVTWQKR